jgi:hypothetical protein
MVHLPVSAISAILLGTPETLFLKKINRERNHVHKNTKVRYHQDRSGDDTGLDAVTYSIMGGRSRANVGKSE